MKKKTLLDKLDVIDDKLHDFIEEEMSSVMSGSSIESQFEIKELSVLINIGLY